MLTSKRKKPAIHREWFRTVSLGGRKSCPSCGDKLAPGESIWSWGEYRYGKWRTVKHFCASCWQPKRNGITEQMQGIQLELQRHAQGCGCEFELVGYGGEKLPEWLRLDKAACEVGG